MQQFARIAEISTKVTGGTFYVHPVFDLMTSNMCHMLRFALGSFSSSLNAVNLSVHDT